MKAVVIIPGLVLCLLAGVAVYARSLSSDPGHWHSIPNKHRDINEAGGVLRVIDADEGTLQRLDEIIRAEPRTQVLAGSVEEGRITYITRSAVFGFPDYTTVDKREGELVIYARLRIGYSDLGVNAARVERWIKALGEG